MVQRHGDELKLVWPQPGIDLDAVEAWDFTHRLIQPLDPRDGDGEAAAAHRQAAMAVVMARPWWRLTLQTHKLLGIR